MVDETPDGVDQAARNAMRAAVMAAAVAAEQVVRQVRAQREQARVESTRRREQLEQRYAAERQLARTALAGADDRWVRSAELDDVVRLVATTAAWAELEQPEFGPRLEQLREQVQRTRNDADVALSSATGTTFDAPRDRRVEAADREGAAVVVAGAGVDAGDDAAEAARPEGNAPGEGPAYDSPARRTELYQRAVEAGADEEVAAGRVLAATAQAAPVADVRGRAAAASGPASAAVVSAERQEAVSRRRGSAVER